MEYKVEPTEYENEQDMEPEQEEHEEEKHEQGEHEQDGPKPEPDGHEDEQSEENNINYDNLTFEILVGGSMRGRCKLKDSKGYCYTVKNQKGNKTWWRCSKRTKSLKCPASVIQIGDTFILGRYPHEHPAYMRRMSRTPKKECEYRQPTWMNGSGEHMDNDSDGDDGSTIYTCARLDENGEGSVSPSKLNNQHNKQESNLQEELLKIERERLYIDKQRLAIEKQRLQIEKQRLEEIKKHNSQCMCKNRVEAQPYSVLHITKTSD